MIPLIKIGNYWFLGKRTIGVTIFPFIFLKKSYFDRHYERLKYTLNHEKIHIRQQTELLVVFFYLWYFTEYFIRLIATGNPDVAYKTISFEKEAYSNENDFEYLSKRKFWSFLKYLG
jgi:hypothetical protein